MFIELSYEIGPDIPVYPGSPRDEFIPVSRMKEGDVCNATVLKHYLHNGTHVDAPFHFGRDSRTIDQISIDDFVYYQPLVIGKRLHRSELVEPADLLSYGDSLYSADILLIFTGFSQFRNDTAVFADDFPAISRESAELIRKSLLNVKAVAIDTLSIESPTLGPESDFEVHRTLLDERLYDTRPLLVYEDVNIARVVDKKIRMICAFPLRLKGLDASPVSMVAEI
ncbi:MAG: cyclase family protein [Deltaproteobacteria bacterium]|nr:cyclase family protein [Deltaproteobacteria bacterium]MBW2120832.1 cyclase family protein [Deltaproteobacteria bacterium]